MAKKTKKTLQYKRGDVITMTSGEYSDFQIVGFLVATADLDLPALARKFHKETAKKEFGIFFYNRDNFPSWLVSNGLAMPVANNVVHLGDYGYWYPEFGIPKDEQ